MSVIEDDVEASGQRDDALLQVVVGVAAARLAAGDVVEPVHALDVEGDLPATLDHGQVARGIRDLRELDDAAVAQCHRAPSAPPATQTAKSSAAYSGKSLPSS